MITSRKVYNVDGLPDETFETEADAAVAAILVKLQIVNGTNWDIAEQAVRNNAAELQKLLMILTEPRNAK